MSMGGHHAVDDLAGANPGIENDLVRLFSM